ncbi:MAG: UDP-N-acetylmuramate--L-alanine ligase [Trueperaceae bacterium]|nr:UDP-N-acetylmuramate--L-alanine ligase [Trueperaceae bacterium]
MSRHLHFMGIGGVSMGGLARHHHAAGDRVSGCDLADGEALTALRADGIAAVAGHDPAHLDGDATRGAVDALVVSAAVAADAPERRAAEARGLPILRRMDVLADLFDAHAALGVTGTHGKSTTSGMLATILLHAGRDPSVQLGATLPALGGVMRYGHGPHLVAEVDESDPGFADLRATVAVVTNLEDDHVAGDHGERRTYHAAYADLEAATRRFARGARTLVWCADWPGLDAVVAGHPDAVRYGEAADADYRVTDLALDGETAGFVLRGPDATTDVALHVPGRFNALNAAAALAAAHRTGVPLEVGAAALAAFRGVGRRWQRWGDVRGARIVDDYAHHPTEVAATLQAARATGRRVRAVLQPHRWVRTARHWPALADAAAAADEVVVLDVYGAGEATIPGVTRDAIVARIRDAGTPARGADLPDAVAYLRHDLADGDLVLTLGAGDVWRVAAALAEEGAA